MKIPGVGWIKIVGITDANSSRYLPVEPPIKIESGDSVTFFPRTGSVRVTRYDDALLEPEWEIFV